MADSTLSSFDISQLLSPTTHNLKVSPNFFIIQEEALQHGAVQQSSGAEFKMQMTEISRGLVAPSLRAKLIWALSSFRKLPEVDFHQALFQDSFTYMNMVGRMKY